MKLVKHLVPLFLAPGILSLSLFAQRGQETAFDRNLRERDDQPVREFIESKENVDVRKKASNLEISGDVRFEYANIHEKGVVLFTGPAGSSFSDFSGSGSSSGDISEDYRNLRGGSHVGLDGFPLSNNDWDVEFNLKWKYSYKKAWCMAHLQFDNPCGIRGRNDCFGTFVVFNEDGSEILTTLRRDGRYDVKGSGDGIGINLKRAYIGYNVWADGKHRFDIELGRRKMDDVFESEIQFSSRFDGLVLKFSGALGKYADAYLTAGAFVIDERTNHFGYAFETGVLNIFNTGLDLKYSLIDWHKHGRINRCKVYPLATQFLVSQFFLTYTFVQELNCKKIPVECYAGITKNHIANRLIYTRHKKKDLGWYIGSYIGAAEKEGDWAMDIEYMWVQAQAVPDFDVGGIGRGNILNDSFTGIANGTDVSLHSDAGGETGSAPSDAGFSEAYYPSRGNANYKGWSFEFLYALTDNLVLDFQYKFSVAEDRHIGGRHKYSYFELETIYAF